ncbi:MAG TPA: hypothetical protein VNN17_09280, partial [Terriglobia bacterium]|nr:hypothetical protein [Terriglobia bacterium]
NPTPELESKLGLAEVRMGKVSQGLHHLWRAVANEPQKEPNHDRLISVLVALNRLPEAAEAAERKLELVAPAPRHYVRAAAIHARLGQWERAGRLLQAALERFPEAGELRSALAGVRAEPDQTKEPTGPSGEAIGRTAAQSAESV